VTSQSSGSRITLLDAHGVAVQMARNTLAANHVAQAEVMLSDCAKAVHGRTFDSVLALLPKGRAVWEQTVTDAAAALRMDGDLYLAGSNRGGIKSAAKCVERVFGSAHVIAYKGGCRVIRAVRGGPIAPQASDYYVWQEVAVQVGGERFNYVTKPGIFSWRRLDDGTRLLIEILHAHPLRPDDQVLDVGCGCGVLTLIAARQARDGHVTGVDVDCRAVEATRRTLALNQVANAEALLSDCGEAVQSRSFTAVITNPPFHQERATTRAIADQIIREAARLLCKGGRLYLVANSFLRYKPMIENAFGDAQVLGETGRFKVWYAVKKAGSR
jgi:16S rRNA (guanine1207-N2)-methyltransferase